MSIIPPVLECPEEPFRGLEPYRFRDQHIFFERETEVRSLIELTTIYRASILYGESGAGKSSLINAGFIPQVLSSNAIPERIRVQPQIDNEFVVERIEGSASENLLSSQLVDGQRTVLSAQKLLSKIQSLSNLRPTMLIFDQFEEFHTLASDEVGSGGVEVLEAQDRIIETLVTLIRDPKVQARLLFVFREDYLAKFDRLFYLCPELPDHFLRLTPPTSGSIREILRSPFTTRSLPHKCWEREISSRLADQLQTRLQPSGNRVAISLAQVQIVALQLWRSTDPEGTLERRGVDGVVEDYLETSLRRFAGQRKIAQMLLTYMITREGTRKVLLQADAVEQSKREAGVRSTIAESVLDRLVEARLVRRDFNRNAPSYEIVSEFLVPWIRRLKLQGEAKRALRRWLKIAGFSFLFLAMVLLGLFFWKYYRTTVEAQKQRIIAQYKHDAEQAEAGRRDAETRAHDALAILSASHDEQVKKLSHDLSVAQTSVDAYRTDTNQLKQRLDENQRSLSESKDNAATLGADLKKLQQENQQLRDELDALKKKLPKSPGDGITATTKPSVKESSVLPSPPAARTSVGGVSLWVGVYDEWHRVVTGLEQENFQVLEDGVPQRITGFKLEDEPSSIAVMLDTSDWAKRDWADLSDAVSEFLGATNPNSEFLLVESGDSPRVAIPFTTSAEEVRTAAVSVVPRGRTRLLDGIYLAAQELSKARYPLKAIVVFSASAIDNSQHRGGDMLSLVRRANLRIYSIWNCDKALERDYRSDIAAIRDSLAALSEAGGGHAFELDNTKLVSDRYWMAETAVRIAVGLRNLYTIQYTPMHQRLDNKYRRINIKLMAPKGLPHLNAEWQSGYYAAPQ